MIKKIWPKLLTVSLLSLFIGAATGYQLQPNNPPPDVARSLTLYAGNEDATGIDPQFTATLATGLTPAAEFEQIASLLSRLEFCHLPIEVTSIEDNTAIVNLKEHEWNQDPSNAVTFPGCSGTSWRSQYFQGSAGGSITSKLLIHTLLQPEAQGDWIESVSFQYEGVPIAADQWDHIFLSGTITRDSVID